MALKPLNLSRLVFGEKHSLPTLMDSTDMSLSKLWEIVKDREAWHAEFMELQRAGHDLGTEQEQPTLIVSLDELCSF